MLTFHAWLFFQSVLQVGENPRSLKLHRPLITTIVVMLKQRVFSSVRDQRIDGVKISRQGNGAEWQVCFDQLADAKFAGCCE